MKITSPKGRVQLLRTISFARAKSLEAFYGQLESGKMEEGTEAQRHEDNEWNQLNSRLAGCPFPDFPKTAFIADAAVSGSRSSH
jgi:hypothetical protein